MLTIQQVANKLQVSTKTLRRWEESGYLVPKREKGTNIRLYYPYFIEYWEKLFRLKRAIKQHLDMLDGLKKDLDTHMLEQDYVPGKPLKLMDMESFIKASDAMDKWNEEFRRLMGELKSYPATMHKAIDEIVDNE